MKLFHISPLKLKTEILIPRLPTRILPTENCTIPRICCAKSITDCVRGAHHQDPIGKTYFVYEIIVENDTLILNSRQLYQLVADAMLTNEFWILTCVKIKLQGKIKVNAVYSQAYPLVCDPNYTIYENIKWNWLK